jgi:glycosyltransferase involved in cell wall biosynthesis
MLKVSVAIITYNQKQFLGQAIESALNQETDFEYEILVGDDLSTDGTRELILDYQEKYPDKVKAVLHPRNLGQNGFWNTVETLKLAKGKYIAPMDGDDYWTDSSKLQLLADHLDQNPHQSACFHNALITHDDGTPSYILNTPDQKAEVTLDDLIGEDEVWFIATSAVLFKGDLMYYPDWFKKSSSGDIPRYIVLAKQGPIGYIPRVMSVYRKNSGGVSHKDHYRDARFLRNRIMMYEGINRESGYLYDQRVRINVSRYYRMMLDSRQYSKSYFRRAGLALKYLWMRRPDKEASKDIIRDYVIPQWMMNVYSFLAIGLHKLRQ